jgi:uncharacterized protein (DUF3820 family)
MSTEEYILTFGKHKNKMLKDIDNNYLSWCINSPTIYNGIKEKIQLYLNSIEYEHQQEKEDNDYVMKFGKYKNKRVKEIYNDDKNYIEWLLNSETIYDTVKAKVRKSIE